MSELRSNKYWRNRPDDERVRNTGIPKRYRTDTLDTFKVSAKDKPTWDLVTKWVETAPEQVENGQGLYIVGATGSGKTHLAQAILKRAVYTHKLCGAFITADNYLQFAYNENKYKEGLPDGYEDPNTMKYMREVYDILVIDSLGAERSTEYAKNTIISLIESRYHEKLPTIITSMLKPQMLESMYNASIASIVNSSCFIAPLKSGDMRIAQWMENNAG